MAPTGTSINKLALDLHVAPNRILEIVKGKRAITADTALRLAEYLGTTRDFWLGLQIQYDLERAQDELAEKIQREVRRRADRENRNTPQLVEKTVDSANKEYQIAIGQLQGATVSVKIGPREYPGHCSGNRCDSKGGTERS